MAYLHRLIAPFGDGPGFLVPLFLTRRGANEECIQTIDQNDNVIAFYPVIVTAPSVPCHIDNVETDLGRPSIWAFRDAKRRVHVGSAEEIGNLALKQVTSGHLRDHQILSAEIVAFCEMEVELPEVLVSAYQALADVSSHSAAVWRDTTILLPAIRQDILTGSHSKKRPDVSSIQAASDHGRTIIYVPRLKNFEMRELPRWKKLALIFQISEFEFRPLPPKAIQSQKTEHPSWELWAMGGVARQTLMQAPFYGPSLNAAPPSRAFVKGAARPATSPSLLVGMTSSDRRDILSLARQSSTRNADYRHAINIRPIGFGTPSTSKVPVGAVGRLLPDFDRVWLVSQHRAKQSTQSHYKGLSAAAIAARHARDTALGLISIYFDHPQAELLTRSKTEGALGLSGSVSHNTDDEERLLLTRLIHNMLSNDAELHSAKSITAIWPHENYRDNDIVNLHFGGTNYTITVLRTPSDAMNKRIVGFAPDVRATNGTNAEFRQLCRSLLAGYGWTLRGEGQFYQLFEDEGEALRIFPVSDKNNLRALAQNVDQLDQAGDIIITNQSIPNSLKNFFSASDVSVLHYSQIHSFMEHEYSVAVMEDL